VKNAPAIQVTDPFSRSP